VAKDGEYGAALERIGRDNVSTADGQRPCKTQRMAPWTSAAWVRLFDQQFHPAVARQRQLRAWAMAPDNPPVLFRVGHGRPRPCPRPRRWPEDFGAISVEEFVAHAKYVREKDTEELGRAVLLAVHRHLTRRWTGGPPHDPRIAVRTVTGGPRPCVLIKTSKGKLSVY